MTSAAVMLLSLFQVPVGYGDYVSWQHLAENWEFANSREIATLACCSLKQELDSVGQI